MQLQSVSRSISKVGCYGASVGRRAAVLSNKQCNSMKMLRRNNIVDVLRRCDCLSIAVWDRLPGDIGTCTIASRAYGVGPSKQVIRLLLKQSSTFFLIEEQRCAFRENFPRADYK